MAPCPWLTLKGTLPLNMSLTTQPAYGVTSHDTTLGLKFLGCQSLPGHETQWVAPKVHFTHSSFQMKNMCFMLCSGCRFVHACAGCGSCGSHVWRQHLLIGNNSGAVWQKYWCCDLAIRSKSGQCGLFFHTFKLRLVFLLIVPGS